VRSRSLVLAAMVVLSACRSERITDPVIPSLPVVPLKDIVIPGLPEPYYHFAYDSLGRVSQVSFAAQFLDYEAKYVDDRLDDLQNNAFGNTDHSLYTYDDYGRVSAVTFLNAAGAVKGHYYLTYDGSRLVKLERDRLAGTVLAINKVLRFTYHPDSNLKQMVDHRPLVPGFQDSSTVTHLFEEYDTNVNVDAFSLLHGDFFDHLVLLPNVLLQRNNPLKETVTSSTQVKLTTYVITVDADKRPLTKIGDFTIVSGPNAGQKFTSQTFFSYY
jgi:hypothetical protein